MIYPHGAVSARPVLAAAVAAYADTLITGNTRDFGHLMRNPVATLPVVLTPRDFLRRGGAAGLSGAELSGASALGCVWGAPPLRPACG